MNMFRRLWPAAAWVLLAAVLVCLAFVLGRRSAAPQLRLTARSMPRGVYPDPGEHESTQLWAHNLLLRKGAHFRVYVRWIRGEMVRTQANQHPSFDFPESFVLEIEKGVVRVKLADVADFLNHGRPRGLPLKNIRLETVDGKLRVTGTAHKLVPLPVRLDGSLMPLPDGRVKYHLDKLSVLKVPMKGLLGLFRIKLSNLLPDEPVPGVELAGNDIYFDTQRLLPPPHIHGQITKLTASPGELTVIYGGAKNDEEKLAQWHNFLRLTGGTVDFGKLTRRDADLTMIDAGDDPWFDLDLVNYQAQLVYGTTHMTEKAGVEVYMPNLETLSADRIKSAQGVTVEWLKNRDMSPARYVAAP
jgi:hypothetical protein